MLSNTQRPISKDANEPMIDITNSAAIKIKELLEEQGKTDHALRIFVRGMSCSGPAYGMALDNEPRDDDNVSDFGGLKVVVDPLSAQYVEGAQVDWVDGLMGRGFTVVNPTYQAEGGGGGCGSGGCSCGH
jgi:iron-sulfur cluster assembly accessory protein